jgi:hypothetical protein
MNNKSNYFRGTVTTMSNHLATKSKRRRFAPVAITTGVLGAVLLSVSMTGTLSGFVASITNSQNTAASGALVMQETNAAGSTICNSTDGGTISTNAATCATINKFGGSTTMVPGVGVSTVVNIASTGTVAPTTFTLAPAAVAPATTAVCVQGKNGTLNGTATDFCSKLNVVIKQGTTTIFTGTAASLAASGAITLSLPAGSTPSQFTFTTTLDSSAGNTYQGESASLPLVWTFGS